MAEQQSGDKKEKERVRTKAERKTSSKGSSEDIEHNLVLPDIPDLPELGPAIGPRRKQTPLREMEPQPGPSHVMSDWKC